MYRTYYMSTTHPTARICSVFGENVKQKTHMSVDNGWYDDMSPVNMFHMTTWPFSSPLAMSWCFSATDQCNVVNLYCKHTSKLTNWQKVDSNNKNVIIADLELINDSQTLCGKAWTIIHLRTTLTSHFCHVMLCKRRLCRHAVSVHLSVTFVNSVKMSKRILRLSSQSGS